GGAVGRGIVDDHDLQRCGPLAPQRSQASVEPHPSVPVRNNRHGPRSHAGITLPCRSDIAARSNARFRKPLDEFSLTIKPVPPFRLDFAAWTLRRRPHNLVDRWDGNVYRRVLAIDRCTFEVAVRQAGSMDAPQLHITTTGRCLRPEWKPAVK